MKPWTIKIELTEGCNLMCPFCGINSIRDKAGSYKFMSLEMANIVAENIARFCPNARLEFEGHGDPLINPQHLTLLRAFRSHLKGSQMQVTTNGIAYVKGALYANFGRLLKIVDFVVLDTYNTGLRSHIRDNLFSPLLKDIIIYDYFRDAGCPSPYANYHRKLNNTIILMDDLLIHEGQKRTRTLHNSAGNNPMIGATLSPLMKTCTNAFREIFICWDGFVPMCCLDFGREFKAGSLQKESFEEIFLGPRLEAARKILNQRFRAFNPCCRCDKKAGHRVGLLPKYPTPTAKDIKHILAATKEGEYLNKQTRFLDKRIWKI